MTIRLCLLLWLALVFTACGRTGPYVWASELPRPSADAARILRPGDKLQVVVHGQETMSGEFEIRPGGDIVLPVAGRFHASGLTPEALTAEVIKRLEGVLAKPYVTIVIAARQPPSVSVLGEVRTPGRYELKDGEGVLDALARAGGLTPFADPDAIFVIRRGTNLPRIRFRFRDLAAGLHSNVGFQLVDGDVVVVE
ncbi:MAG: polysaccharide biosynthesis/export family protein [Pseudomonadota bacterium]|nr:MAG: sugar ABC transporter substrate-binding protein [Pseudomonadota bacterium]